MPKFLGMEPQTAKMVGLAALGVGGLYLLTHRSSGGTAGDAGLPITGPPQLGNQTPHATGNYFDQNEAVAHQLSKDESFTLKRLQQDQATLIGDFQQSGPPVISKAWQQVQGGWLGIKADNRGRFLSEENAISLGPENRGPYAKGRGSWAEQLISQVGNAVSNAAGAWTGYELGQIPRPPQKKQPVYTPAHTYGNPISQVPTGQVQEQS